MKTFILFMVASVAAFAQTAEDRSIVSFTNEYIPELDERVLTREEIWEEPKGKEYYPINDIITKKTLFIPVTGANKAFYQSLNYYNRNLFMALRKAAEKAREDKKTMYVNIVGGQGIPAHTFGGRNNTYKASEYTEGQWTVLGISPKGDLVKDHYQHGEYGKLGRDGISYEHAIKTFKATALRKAAERAEKNDEENDWHVIFDLGDQVSQTYIFKTFSEYEEFYNLTRLYEQDKSSYEVKKVKASKPLTEK
tara:strand:- start:6456 stop:7208 length:753 start_codon:yes stop_codon:yes gene_type:complete